MKILLYILLVLMTACATGGSGPRWEFTPDGWVRRGGGGPGCIVTLPDGEQVRLYNTICVER